MLCTDRDILEKGESTQVLSAFYDYFSGAPAEGQDNVLLSPGDEHFNDVQLK